MSLPFLLSTLTSVGPILRFVKRSIDNINSIQPMNLLCKGYDRKSRTSAVVDMLTSLEWKLLLRRVGDVLMFYLLKNTCIFLAMPRNNFQQIAGLPISHNFSRLISEKHQIADHVLTKKRKSFEGIKSTSAKRMCLGSQASMYSTNICTNGFGSVITEEISLKNADECSNQDKICTIGGSGSVITEEISLKNADQSSNQDYVSSRKRRRQYRWQRQRKRA